MAVVRLREHLSTKKTKKQKFFRVFGTGFFVLAFLILAPIAIIQNFMPERGFDILGFRMFLTADTKSMEPLLSHNDLIIVKRYDFSQLKNGDIVTFKTLNNNNGVVYEKYITHQIVDYVTDDNGYLIGFVTSGVNEVVGLDPLYLTEFGENGTNKYIGLMYASNRVVGRVLAFVISPVGLILIAINSFILIIGNVYIRKLRFEDRRDKDLIREFERLQKQINDFDVQLINIKTIMINS